MGFLHPVEPLILTPSKSPPVLDRATERERAQLAFRTETPGLPGLVSHQDTPRDGFKGLSGGQWSASGMRGVYLVQEKCVLPGGVEKNRCGVILSIDPDVCPFQPIVSTSRRLVDCLADHVHWSGVDPVGVGALYRDEDHHLDRLVEARGDEPPFVHVEEPLGGSWTIWLLSPEEGAAVTALIECCSGSIVGDVALYRAILKLRDHPSLSSPLWPAAYFFNQRDFGITLTSTVRVYPTCVEFSLNDFVALLHETYEVEEVSLEENESGGFRRFTESVRMEGVSRRVVGLIARDLHKGLLIKLPEDEPLTLASAQVPEVALEFDSEWVERGIVHRFLPPEMHMVREVRTDAMQAKAALESSGAELAFIVNPPPKRLLPDLSAARWRLPRGSLQLKPPFPRGLFLHPLRSVSPS